MDNFDKKIKKLAQLDNWQVPHDIDEKINNSLNTISLNVTTKNKKRPFRVAVLVASLSVITITTTFGIDKIIDYFKFNKQSIFQYEEGDLNTYGKKVNLSTKDKGIELNIESIALDDSYLNVVYKVKSEKKIKDINSEYLDSRIANPYLSFYIGANEIIPDGTTQTTEGTIVSDNEVKGIIRYSVAKYDVNRNQSLKIKTNEIFGISGNWSVESELKEIMSKSSSKKYAFNKEITLVKEFNGEKIKINVKVDNIVLSPLGNQITITEKSDKRVESFVPMLGTDFALFDENNKSLDLIDRGGIGADRPNTPIIQSYEFLKTDKNTKAITLVPYYIEKGVVDDKLEPQSIEKLPITFKISKHGKVVIDSFEANEKFIKYTYHIEGISQYNAELSFYDENGNDITSRGLEESSIDRKEGKYTKIIKFGEGYKKVDVSKIKKASIMSANGGKLNYSNKIKLDLK